MRLFVDFFPILLFFIAFKWFGLYAATGVAMVAAMMQLAWIYWRTRRVEKMLLLTSLLILILGGATLLFHDEWFIKWKPTLINWVFAGVFLVSQYWGKKSLIKQMLAGQVALPDDVWSRLNHAWIGFFLLMGTANLYVIYHFNTDVWVNFKLFGMLGLTVCFALGQSIYLAGYMKTAEEEPLEENV